MRLFAGIICIYRGNWLLKKMKDAIEKGSVMTWAHFNLHGEFDFSDEKMQDSIGLVYPKNSSSKTA